MPEQPSSARYRTALDRALSLFTEVRGGEGATAVALAINVFLLLTTYYIIKPVREALILSGGGAELKSYVSAGQTLLLIPAVGAYAALASGVPRRRLITIVTVFFAACLVAFYVLSLAGTPYLGVAFFLFVGIFNLMIVSQFWAFANDIYTPAAGKRLFPLVGFGASAGAVAGSYIAGLLIPRLGIEQMLVVAAVLLTGTLTLTFYIDHRERHRARAPQGGAGDTTDAADEAIGGAGAFALVLQNRYLLLIGLLLLLLNWVNTTGEFMLGKLVTEDAVARVEAGQTGGLGVGDVIGTFYSDFFLVVNIIGLTLQLFFVSRILKYLGVQVALLILPLIAMGGYLLLAFYPLLGAVRWAKTAENATDYSLQNTVRNVLFLPLSREEKYKAKQAIDTFFVRLGDVLSAALVFVGTNLLALSIQGFAWVNAGLVVVWVLLAIAIGRRYRLLTRGEANS